MDPKTANIIEQLRAWLRNAGSVAVAYSGGVDSTLLSAIAHEELGDQMLAVTAASHVLPHRDLERTRMFCAEHGMRHVELVYDELSVPGFAQNHPDRCYTCKHELFVRMRQLAASEGIPTLVDGSNVDDEGDYRPGLRALAELGIASPFREVGLTKDEIRAVSRQMGLPTWDMPSAACLASRFAYGEVIDEIKLKRVELAEDYLADLGFVGLRVRIHGKKGELARIEVATSDIARLAVPEAREQVVAKLRELGFKYVSVDLAGFRSGSMNEVLT